MKYINLFRQKTFPCALGFLVLIASGCAPTIRLDTPEPVQIDVNMKVEVVQKNAPALSGTGGTGNAVDSPKEKSARQKQRERLAEVQTLKNDRIVGEATTGLLELVNPPAKKEYAEYAAKIVAEENTDRQVIFAEEAKQDGSTVEAVAQKYASRRQQGAFPGELIQGAEGTWTPR